VSTIASSLPSLGICAFVALFALGPQAVFAQLDFATPYAFTTLAGPLNNPGADGDKFVARFTNPSGVAVDSRGDLFIADAGDDTIREMSPAGIFSTIAGVVGSPGSADSEVLLTLPPGGYTAEVTGADSGTGVALCAIYQLP
jgi:hypothetical protein